MTRVCRSMHCVLLCKRMLQGTTCHAEAPVSEVEQSPAVLPQLLEQLAASAVSIVLCPCRGHNTPPLATHTSHHPAALTMFLVEMKSCRLTLSVPACSILAAHMPISSQVCKVAKVCEGTCMLHVLMDHPQGCASEASQVACTIDHMMHSRAGFSERKSTAPSRVSPLKGVSESLRPTCMWMISEDLWRYEYR